MNVKDIINGMADRAFAYSFRESTTCTEAEITEIPSRIIRQGLTSFWRFSRTTRKRR